MDLDIPGSVKWVTSNNGDPTSPYAVGRATTPSGESGVEVECKISGAGQTYLDIALVDKFSDVSEFFGGTPYVTSTKHPEISASYEVIPQSGSASSAQTAKAKDLAQHAADVSKP